MNEKSYRAWWLFAIFALALQACATISPDELSHRISKADAAVTQAALLAADLRSKGHINDEDWAKVQRGIDDASIKVDQAWKAYDEDPEKAAKNAQSAEAIIEAVKDFLPVIGLDKPSAAPAKSAPTTP